MKSKILVNKKPATAIVILLSFFCFVFACRFIWSGGCLWWICAPERNFRVSDLELPSNLFPEGSIVNHVYPMSDEHRTIDDGSQSIFWNNGNGNAGYDIYRFPDEKQAADEFEFSKRSLVKAQPGETWDPPAELPFSSSTANTFYVACVYWRLGTKTCVMVARYQEFTIYFSGSMDEKMTFSRFEKIVIFIDKLMSSRLYP